MIYYYGKKIMIIFENIIRLFVLSIVMIISAMDEAVANEEELIQAIENEDKDKVAQIISSGAINPNQILIVRERERVLHGTPLMIAVEISNIEMVRFLIELGCQPNSMAGKKLPLHCAARRGNLEMVKMFIHEFNSDPLALTGIGHGEELPLHFAAARLHLPVVQYLLNLAPETINAPSSQSCPDCSFTPLQNVLHQLTESTQNITLIEFLLEQGANPNKPADREGNNFLHLACKIGNIELVRLIVNHPSFDQNLINSANSSNQTPLQVALDNGHTEIAALLEGAGGITFDLSNSIMSLTL